jgi:hypothetical protein
MSVSIFPWWLSARPWLRRCAALSVCAIGLAAPRLPAQIFIPSPDNTLTGNTYFENDTEVNGNAWVDGGGEIAGTLYVDDAAYVTNDLYATNIYSLNLFNDYTADEFTVTGNLELTSGFSPGMSESWGAAYSWLHSGLDFGDLTYTYTDTPAFNISQNTDGTYFYPTIYFTGYDANTTWVWQENGLAAMSNSSLLGVQMELSGSGNLTMRNPANGNSMVLDPQDGGIAVSNANGTLTVGDANSSTITFDASSQTITFYNGTTNDTSSISPNSTAFTFSTTSSGQAYGTGASATANYAFALGNGTLASGNGSFAIGNHVTAAYFDSIVLGQWNDPISGSGSGNTTWVSTDPLFVIGNGTDVDHPSNALVMLKNGDTTLNGNLTVTGNATFNGTSTTLNSAVNFTGNVTVQPQGDILMGQFGD